MIKCTKCSEPVHDKETGLCDKHYRRYKRQRKRFYVITILRYNAGSPAGREAVPHASEAFRPHQDRL